MRLKDIVILLDDNTVKTKSKFRLWQDEGFNVNKCCSSDQINNCLLPYVIPRDVQLSIRGQSQMCISDKGRIGQQNETFWPQWKYLSNFSVHMFSKPML